MKIRRIELEGFRGFRDPETIDVPSGFLVLEGPNGSGKSSVCDAIDFCLTGNIAKFRVETGGKEHAKDYYWWRGEGRAKDHFVRLEFADDAGQTFTVARTRDGCDRSEEEIRNALCEGHHPENPLGVLTDTSILRDDSISALSLDLEDTERYQRVQRALGAVVDRDYTTRAKRILAETETLQRKSAASEQSARQDLNQLVARIAELRSRAASDTAVEAAVMEVQKVYPTAPTDAGELTVFLRGTLGEIQVLLRHQSTAWDRARQILAEIGAVESSQFKNDLSAAEMQTKQLEAATTDSERNLRAAEGALKAEHDADEMAAAYALLLQHGEHIGLQDGHCPLCASNVSAQQFNDAIATARERLNDSGRAAAEAQKHLNEARERHFSQMQALDDQRRKLESLRSRGASVESLRTELADILHRSRLQGPDSAHVTAQGFEVAVQRSREQILFLERNLRAIESSALVSDIMELEQRAAAVREQAEQFAIELGRAKRASTLAKSAEHTIKRVAGELLDERLSAISPLLSELFLRLKPHSNWREIDYRVRGDVRRFLSISVGDDLNPQFVFSSGQKRVTGLAFLLSMHLARHWCRWRTLVLDDPVQHIDDYRAMNLVEVLCAIRREGRQIICAVEDTALADLLCRRLRASEHEAGARVTLEPGLQGRSSVVERVPIAAAANRVLAALGGIAPPTPDGHLTAKI